MCLGEVGVLPQGKEREDYAQKPGDSPGHVLAVLCHVITANRKEGLEVLLEIK